MLCKIYTDVGGIKYVGNKESIYIMFVNLYVR